MPTLNSTSVPTSANFSYVEDGVIWWANKKLDLEVSSKGQVRDFATKSVIQPHSTATRKNTFASSYTEKGVKYHISATFDGYFNRLALGNESLKGHIIVKKDASKDFTPDNVVYVHSAKVRNLGLEPETIHAPVYVSTPAPNLAPEGCLPSPATFIPVKKEGEKNYTVHEDTVVYITEDFAEFSNRKAAEEHQAQVSRGKMAAQVVHDYNGGWVLAEEIFLLDVGYVGKKPYKHFREVYENNTGLLAKASDSFAILEYGSFKLKLDVAQAEELQQQIDNIAKTGDDLRSMNVTLWSRLKELAVDCTYN